MKYTTTYCSSSCQLSNSYEIHESLNAALAAWSANIRSLLPRSGGDSTLEAWEEAELDSECPEPSASISWNEHCEGGYVIASGFWMHDIADFAKYEQENGETLTPEKLVRYLYE